MMVDLSHYSDEELQAMAAKAAPAPAADLSHYSDDDLRAMQHALTVHGSAPPPPADDTGSIVGEVGHDAGVAGRAALEGVTGGVLGLPALAGDAALNAGGAIGYGAKYLASKTGLVEPPEAKNYFPGMPLSNFAEQAAEATPDALGLPHATTGGGKIAANIMRSLVGAGTGIGAGSALAGAGRPALATLGRFLAAQPGTQLAGAAAGGGAQQVAQNAGASPAVQNIAGLVGGLAPAVGARGVTNLIQNRARDVTRPAGQFNAAAEITQGLASDPARAAAQVASERPYFPGNEFSGVAATADPGIMSASQKLLKLNEGGAAEQAQRNNRAAADLLSDHGFTAGSGRGAVGRADPNAGRPAALRADAGTAAENFAPTLSRQRNVDVSDLVDHIDHLTDAAANPNAQYNVRLAAQAARRRILDGANAVYRTETNAAGEQVRVLDHYEQSPANLYRARKDISAASGGLNASRDDGYLANARRELHADGGIIPRLDNVLEDQHPGYADHMAEQRRLRTEADQYDLGNAMVDRMSNSQVDAQGTPQFSTAKILNIHKGDFDVKRFDNGNRLTPENLTPEQQNAFQRLHGAAERDSRVGGVGLKSGHSPTNPLENFDKHIDNVTTAAMPGYTKAMRHAGKALAFATPALAAAGAFHSGAAGGGVGAGFGMTLAAGGHRLGDVARNMQSTAKARVAGILGEGAVQPERMHQLLTHRVVRAPRKIGYVTDPLAQALRLRGALSR